MIKSMTAFASASIQADWGRATWEIRTVNHRYFEVNIKLPEALAEDQLNWRKCIGKAVHRGKVECQLTYILNEDFSPKMILNEGLAKQIVQLAKQVKEMDMAMASHVNPLALLNWPKMVTPEVQDLKSLIPDLTQLLEQVLHDLVEMRAREGREMAQVLEAKLNAIQQSADEARLRVPASLEKQKDKITNRLNEMAQQAVDSDRMAQEMAIIATKWDISEELDRLDCHVQEVKKLLHEKDPQGRRLDFLMQEMNREANTLGSKSQDIELSRQAVDIKVLVEQMREQIQNVE